MSSNFAFLAEMFPTLEKLGGLAERYLYSDPNACIYKLGAMAETTVGYMFELDNLDAPDDDTLNNRVRILKREGMLPHEIDEILYQLRKKRNRAVHQGHDSLADAKILLNMAFTLTVWFMQTYGDYKFEPTVFVLPKDESSTKDYKKLLLENEALLEKLQNKEVANLSSDLKGGVTTNERKKRGAKAAHNMQLSEDETRRLIDEQLLKVGWEADTVNLRYANGTRPQKGRNLAIAEWPTNSTVCKWGAVDYALFCGMQLVGVIEAKAMHKDISSVIDNQCREYSLGIKDEDGIFVIKSWNGYKAPFLFATNGRPYLEQLKTKSGIWFRDAREESNIPKALKGWISPEGMREMLERDIVSANRKLLDLSTDLLRDPDGLNLRHYQIEAIEKAQQAVLDGKQTVLLAMATGTGKTRTVLGMIYQFLKTDRFKRILFLVDRTALGEQAQDVFKEVKIEELMTIDEIYDIKNLGEKEIDRETKIHVATVQSLVQRILYNEGDRMPSVTDYDLVVVDEAHRGYILDKEMSDDEQLYRSQSDYVSKYRAVIEYFDAVKIALTATPALHTTEIFGPPVFEYSYRRAVIEGYLVDHDAPHNIMTKLREEGITYHAGETVAIYDPVTGEITNGEELADEIRFDVDSFNRRVITESYNRTTLMEIADDLNPEGDGKTLIYAVDDNHADMITTLLKEIYEPMDVNNDAIMKITGSIGGGNPKKVQEAIKRFKNEKYPNIVITVDLLTTGIDVPEITNLVFMRRVKSRILFEQMLGRATRLCPDIEKTHFEIYDPVGVYESMDAVNTMKPVVNKWGTSFEDLLNGIEMLDTEQKVQNQLDMLIAKVQRKQNRLRGDALEHFVDLSGGLNPSQFAEKLSSMKTPEAKAYTLNNRELFHILNEGSLWINRPVIISNKEDELVSHTRDYGKGQKPQDYLEEFNDFIVDNLNKIAALKLVCTRPRDLTREDLKSLKLELDRHSFTEQQLNTAWKEWKNEDIAADIISFIRRSALGSALIDHDDRIRQAMKKLKRNHKFSKTQLDWLERIEKNMIEETIVDQETFERGAFKTKGGYKVIDKLFKDKLRDYLQELNDYLYDDGGELA